MLEEDAAKFDAFLKDNDAAVQEAQRRADAETAARQAKVGQPVGRSHLHLNLSFLSGCRIQNQSSVSGCRRDNEDDDWRIRLRVYVDTWQMTQVDQGVHGPVVTEVLCPRCAWYPAPVFKNRS